MSPTQKSLAECRERGWTCQVVERWIPQARRRIDFLGVIDIIALTGTGILGIQACAGASHAARRTKAMALPGLRAWLECGGVFAIWSWSKRGARGKRKVWTLREERITTEMLP